MCAGEDSSWGGCSLSRPFAAKQGETAAVNALGGNAELTSEVPATILNGGRHRPVLQVSEPAGA
jgi:nitrite reductase (NADH) large subunit